MEFNEKLQELRKQKELTQEQLAEKLYVSRTAVLKKIISALSGELTQHSLLWVLFCCIKKTTSGAGGSKKL